MSEAAATLDNPEFTAVDPMLRTSQFTALVKAEVDAMLSLRDLPACAPQQIHTMVSNAVQLFLRGHSPDATLAQYPRVISGVFLLAQGTDMLVSHIPSTLVTKVPQCSQPAFAAAMSETITG